jgi:NitT/TauT family transport system permease protein
LSDPPAAPAGSTPGAAPDTAKPVVGPWVRKALPVVLGFAAFLGIWYLLRVLEVWEPVLFPGPVEVWHSLAALAREGDLARALVVTLKRLAIGYGIGLLGGMLLSFGFIWRPAIKRGLSPLLIGLQGLPGVAWVPLALIWFGYSENAILFVTVMGCLFTVAMGFSDAFANVPPIYGRAARNMGAKGFSLLVRVRIPSATPSLIGSAKVAWSFAWRSLLSAEILIPSLGGLGFLLNSGREVNDVAQVMASMVAAISVGIAFERLVFAQLETRVRRRWGLAT